MYKCAQILGNYELIHVHMRHNYRYIQLIKKLFFVKTTVILHDHYGSIDVDKSVPFGLKSLLKPTYYIGVSKTLLNWAVNNLKLPSNSVFLLTNSVLKEPQSEIGTQKKGIVLVGNIKPIKNQLFAIRLMEHINNTLTIIGQIQDEKYYVELKQLIKDLKMEQKIIFVHNSTNIQYDIQQFEFGLQTAKSESGPLVLIEYLAQSLPFLTFNTGQVVDDIKSDTPQLIMDNFEIEQWAMRLHEVQKMDLTILNNVYQKYFSEKMYLANCESIYKAITMNEISA